MYHSSAYIVSTIFVFFRCFCVLFAIFCFSSAISCTCDSNLLAEEYRVDNSVPFVDEHEREEQVLQTFCSTVAEHSFFGSLENAIRHFVAQTISSNLNDFSIIDAFQTNKKGRSSNSVFFIHDAEGHLCYVVKAFPEPCRHPSEYLAEISALCMLMKLSLAHVSSVIPLSYAIYRDENKSWGLLLETAANGKRMDEYLFPLIGSELNFELFQNTIPLVKKAFSRMGKSLAQLHGNHEIYGPVPDWCLKRYEERLEKILANEFICKRFSDLISLSEFTAHVNQIKEQIFQLSIPYTYWHGDAHFGNMFYFEEGDSFCFIDAARMHISIDYKGTPTMDGTLDLMRIEENLKILSTQGLPEDIAKMLQATFYQSYLEEAKRLPSQKLVNFYKVFMLMGRLIIYSKYDMETDPSKKNITRDAFESALCEFEALLYS